MSFEPELADPFIPTAVKLRDQFAADAVARDKAGGRPTEQIKLLKESGLPSIQIPRRYGGEGASWVTVLRIVREFAHTDGSLAHLFGYHHLPINGVYFRGTEAQKEDLLGRSAKGNWVWGNSGNAMAKSSTGRRDGNDWILNGNRPFSSGSHIADYLQIAWEIEGDKRLVAAIPTDREGLIIEDDWDGIGQRQTGSGRVTVKDLRVHGHEIIGSPEIPLTPFASLTSLFQQAVLLNVFVGSAQGALTEGRGYTTASSRPWIYSGVERHIDDPWVKRVYGDLYIKTLAATELADEAARSLDAAYERGEALTTDERGRAAIDLATANVYAGEIGLAVSSGVFEVTGARSATNSYGFDRFWRNVRTYTLHNPAEYKKRTVGNWLLTGEFPVGGLYR
jgi:alkylation response protein AidB-like acyl-CoA dehydrogenase